MIPFAMVKIVLQNKLLTYLWYLNLKYTLKKWFRSLIMMIMMIKINTDINNNER